MFPAAGSTLTNFRLRKGNDPLLAEIHICGHFRQFPVISGGPEGVQVISGGPKWIQGRRGLGIALVRGPAVPETADKAPRIN